MESMFDYGDIAAEAAGRPGWWMAQGSIVASQVGFCCAYLIFIVNNVSSLLPTISPNRVLLMLLLPEVSPPTFLLHNVGFLFFNPLYSLFHSMHHFNRVVLMLRM